MYAELFIFTKKFFISKQFTLGKDERLKSRKLIEQLFRQGKNFSVYPFRVYYIYEEKIENPATEIMIDADVSWRLFSKCIRPEQVKDKIEIKGNKELAEVALTMVSVMA